ncbi:MAG TPA: histidine phosphatase family protein [Usitatibacter sp.]|nr:histidine phosphatase family protein [Usitatibacter sp.]
MEALLRCTIGGLAFVAAAAFAQQERTSLPAPRHALEGPALVRALRQGGLTVYFRHGATHNSQVDREPFDRGDCTKQRNLTDEGRKALRAAADALVALKAPIGDVFASPYCRTMESARLLLGRATAADAVLGAMTDGKPDYSALDRMLAAPPKGQVRIVVGHGHVFRALAGLPYLDEGEAAVLVPVEGRWEIAARLKLGDWVKLPLS